MKACPVCGRLYPPDAGFCPADGAGLLRATDVPVPSDDQDARIGQLMGGRYQVRRVVADGGMGRVYEALDLRERRNVALKVLHPEVVADEVALERFKREFSVSKQLPHHHIVEVLDFGPTHDGSYALVMEFLYGEELRATLKREKVLSPERVVRIVSQMAVALDEAHARKLVHRDLKPENVFLCQTSEGDIVKLLDFGSVKDKADNAKKLTVMGTTIGSPYYMAPEQAQGLDTLDHRADVWAIGAMIYECISGEVPFQGNNGPSILLEILTKEPRPPSVAARGQRYPVPRSIDRIIAHALRKQAATRIPSAGDLADALGAAYGLRGGHRDWAYTREKDLGERIRLEMPRLLEATPTGPAGDQAADAFFGESASLEVLGDPFSASPASPAGSPGPRGAAVRPVGGQAASAAARSAQLASQGDDEPVVVPTSPAVSLGLLALVGLVALMVGVFVALLLI